MDFGCSSFSWTTEDGRHLLGRTYDRFGDLAANQIIGAPQGAPCAQASIRKEMHRSADMPTPEWRCWALVSPFWWMA